ncbi:MAG TPA: chemotaxis protein CheB [Terriglobales bacterium]|nr:chemotaxis protein CheB [Terriglobales bacterium]
MASRKRKRRSPLQTGCELIAIGASAGGLPALLKIVSTLGPDGPAIVVVQHLDPHHKSQIPQLLARRTNRVVKEAEDGEPIEKGIIYIGPADEHLLVSAGRIQLVHSRLIRFSRPSIDVMFTSVATTYGKRAAGVILSGSNRDGADGIAAIKRAGGVTIAQSPESAEYRIMPQAAIDTGCVDHVVSLDKMGKTLSQLC